MAERNEARGSLSASRQNDRVPGLRQCPHGVDVGPLDDYERGPDDLVASSYCDICNRAWELRGHDGYVTEADIAKAEAERGRH